jgi:hypothetical protein
VRQAVSKVLKAKPLPPLSLLQEELSLDAYAGVLYWKKPKQGRVLDRPIGVRGTGNRGYQRLMINGQEHYVHRVVWALANDADPRDLDIDHVNGDPRNNHPSNLRLATRSENLKLGADRRFGRGEYA